MGFDLHGKTVAVVGTGKIGHVFARIMLGFGCEAIGYDKYPSPEFEMFGARYAEPREIGARADIISLHCPLMPETHHIVNADTLARVKRGALLVNTSRSGLWSTPRQLLKPSRANNSVVWPSMFMNRKLICSSVTYRAQSFPMSFCNA